jgi:hypothetical protein
MTGFVREVPFGALFNILSTLKGTPAPPAFPNGLIVVSRVFKLLKDCNDAELPGAYLVCDDELYKSVQGLPPKRTLRADIYLYCSSPDPNISPDIQLSYGIDAIEAILAPDPVTQVQTLGGLVQHAYIAGEIPRYQLPKGQRSAALIPVEILVP